MSTFTVLNPATEEPVTTLTQASAADADEAIARASAALPGWRAVSPGDRARMLRAFAAAVDAASEELAGLEVSGSGHPIGAARWEAGQVRDVLLYYSAAPERLSGKQIPVPGGDVNPYLAVAAMIAAGLHGIDNELPLEPPLAGNAYTDTSVRVPHTLHDALDLWEKSELAREAFGAEVVEHYANYARVELTAYEAAVTDWELRRGFERL